MGLENIAKPGIKKTIDGKEYLFSMSFKSFKILAQKYGTVPDAHKVLSTVLENRASFLMTEANLDVVATWTFASLAGGIKGLTMDDVEDLLTPDNMWLFFGGMIEALTQGTPKADNNSPPAIA